MSTETDTMGAKTATDLHQHRVPLWSWRLAREMHLDRGRRAAEDNGITTPGEPEVRTVGDVVFLTWRREPATRPAA